MSEQKTASQTAETTLLLRALACGEPDSRIRGADHMAALFLPEETRRKLGSEAYRNAVKAALPEGLYAYSIARTACFDAVFAHALRAGFSQIVLLGAGYDTRAYRLASPTGSAKIFEVDAPPTQEQKRALVEKNGLAHGNVVFVPVDFEKDSLAKRLGEKGYTPSLATLFILEGVTLYLTPEALEATLRTLRNVAARGSLLALDYLNRSLGAEQDIRRKDERVLFGMPPAALEGWLASLGWRTLENLDGAAMSERWLTCENGESFAPVKQTMNLLTAETAA